MGTTVTQKSSGLIRKLLRDVDYPNSKDLLDDPSTFPEFFGEGHYDAVDTILQVAIDTLCDDMVDLIGPTLDQYEFVQNTLDADLTKARNSLRAGDPVELANQVSQYQANYAVRGDEIDRLNRVVQLRNQDIAALQRMCDKMERQYEEACAEADRLNEEGTLATAEATELFDMCQTLGAAGLDLIRGVLPLLLPATKADQSGDIYGFSRH
jgi:hypothetical protein